MSKQDVVILEYKDAKKAARTLYEAFDNDDVARYVSRHLEDEPDKKKEVDLQFYEAYVVSHIMKGICLGIKGDDDEFETVSCWVKPDSGSMDDYITLIRSGFAKVAWNTGSEGRRRIFAILFKVLHDYYDKTMELDPENGENCWTLVYLGSTPKARGKGNVRRMFDYVFQNYIDPMNSLTYLESSAIRNLPIYERFGFRAVNAIYLGDTKTDDHARMDVMIRGPQGETWKYLNKAREEYGYVIPDASVAK